MLLEFYDNKFINVTRVSSIEIEGSTVRIWMDNQTMYENDFKSYEAAYNYVSTLGHQLRETL